MRTLFLQSASLGPHNIVPGSLCLRFRYRKVLQLLLAGALPTVLPFGKTEPAVWINFHLFS